MQPDRRISGAWVVVRLPRPAPRYPLSVFTYRCTLPVKRREPERRLHGLGRMPPGARSRNAYARYERGASVPTVVKLEELLKAISPGHDIVVCESGEG
jgi:hypothetical protein